MNKRHPLGARARKQSDGIMVVRFEMPFPTWCTSCNELHPRGRRFNAEKKEVEKYLSSPVFSFRFKCNACFNYIEIRTDPKNSDFIVTEGGRRRFEASESDETNENLPKIKSKADREVEEDPFARLEQVHDDQERGKVAIPVLEDIQKATERRHGDSVQNNRLLRSLARVERNRDLALVTEAKTRGLGITLLPLTTEDETEAKQALQAAKTKSKLQVQTRVTSRSRAAESIFKPSSSASSTHKARLLSVLSQKKADMSIFQPRKK